MSVFSPEWQAQRELKQKHCPSCKAEVEVEFGARPYLTWLVAVGGVCALAALLFGLPVLVAVLSFVLAIPIALLPSAQLRATYIPRKRIWFMRPIALPTWLSPPPRLQAFGRGVWAVVSCVGGIAAIAIGLPELWAGLLLTLTGAIGLIKGTIHFHAFELHGLGAQLFFGAWLLAGVALCVHHYALYLPKEKQ